MDTKDYIELSSCANLQNKYHKVLVAVNCQSVIKKPLLLLSQNITEKTLCIGIEQDFI